VILEQVTHFVCAQILDIDLLCFLSLNVEEDKARIATDIIDRHVEIVGVVVDKLFY
jgi:hypothetical protein